MRQHWTAIRGVALVALVLITLVIMSRQTEHGGVAPGPAATAGFATVVNDYPVDALVRFEGVCRNQGAPLATCVCLFHGLENHYTYAQFQALVAADNPQAPEYTVVARDCAGQ
jgi:hypothetical protein